MKLPRDFFKLIKDPTHSGNLVKPYYVMLVRRILDLEKEVIRNLTTDVYAITQYAVSKSRRNNRFRKFLLRKSEDFLSPFTRMNMRRYIEAAFNRGVKQASSKLKQVRIVPPQVVPSSTAITNLLDVNVSLIKSVSTRYLSTVKTLVIETLNSNKSVDELAKDIKKVSGVSINRASAIANNEIRRALNNGRARTYKQVGITHWMWQSSREPNTCSFCPGLHGIVVKVDDSFGKSPFTKRKVFKPPDPHPNCRCTLLPVPAPAIPQVKKGVVLIAQRS